MRDGPVIDETIVRADDWATAVAETDGPQLVVAGPGAGKTEFLVRRTAHLVAAGADPTGVRLLTFSRRGAAELTDRVRRAIGRGHPAPRASTFHSLASRILETHGPTHRGWSEPPALLTGPEQVSLVAELLADDDPAGWPEDLRGLLGSRSFAEEVTDFLLRAAEHGMDPEAVAAAATTHHDWAAIPAFMARYRRALGDSHRIDYAALLAEATELAAVPEVAESLAAEIEFVLVDEYQDTTPAQADFLAALVPRGGNLTVAADPYQSIYSFRGAALENVERFPTEFPHADGRPARRFVLAESFRVPEGILRPAERLTAGVLPGAAGPVTPAGPGGRVDVFVFDQQTHEADWIASEVERLHLAEQLPLDRIAVLVRSTRRFLPDLSRSLDRHGIPHDRPDARLVDHPAVRVVADVVTLAGGLPAPEAEQRRAARRLLLGPVVGLTLGGERDVLRERLRSTSGWDQLVGDLPDAPDGLAEVLADASWATDLPAAEGFWHLWSTIPALADVALGEEGWRTALASFSQVLHRLAERDRDVALAPYLEAAEGDDYEASPLIRHEPADTDHLVVTTLHQAKGLEFDVVFIADAVDGVLPDLRRNASILDTHLLPASRRDRVAASRFRIQEEMRLAYTAMTRARRRVVWTATAAGLDETEERPSRFIDALVDEPPRAPEPATDRPPVTGLEAEARLRRTLTDPGAPAPDRLAALAVLAAGHPALSPVHDLPGVAERGSDGGLVPDDAQFSPSQATAYETCPRRYALERHLGIGDEPSVYMHFGSLVHAVAERVDGDALATGTAPTSDEALAVLDDLFDPADFGGQPWSDHWHRRAVTALTNLYDHPPADDWQPVLVEHDLRLDIDGERWRGRADRIDAAPAGVRIVDYKTGKSAMTRKRAAENLQLAFYALAASADPTVSAHGEVAGAELWYPLATTDGVARRSFDLAKLEEAGERLAAIAAAIRDERFPPTVSRECDRCAVRVLCDAWPDGSEAFVP